MKTIEFVASSQDVYDLVDKPQPASRFIPDWYKESFSFFDSNKMSFGSDHMVQATVKSCMPVFDSITAGYIQSTWAEIYIESLEDGRIIYRYSTSPEIMDMKPESSKQKLPTPYGCSPHMFNWKRYWIPKTPKGYSILITHPMYQHDLPFVCLPGIVDSDNYFIEASSPPFFIKKGFTGIIPKGTPMYQMIPIKRDSWHSKFAFEKYKGEMKKQLFSIDSKFYGSYKKIFWNRKNYE